MSETYFEVKIFKKYKHRGIDVSTINLEQIIESNRFFDIDGIRISYNEDLEEVVIEPIKQDEQLSIKRKGNAICIGIS